MGLRPESPAATGPRGENHTTKETTMTAEACRQLADTINASGKLPSPFRATAILNTYAQWNVVVAQVLSWGDAVKVGAKTHPQFAAAHAACRSLVGGQFNVADDLAGCVIT
jgi:hypothetical protein